MSQSLLPDSGNNGSRTPGPTGFLARLEQGSPKIRFRLPIRARWITLAAAAAALVLFIGYLGLLLVERGRPHLNDWRARTSSATQRSRTAALNHRRVKSAKGNLTDRPVSAAGAAAIIRRSTPHKSSYRTGNTLLDSGRNQVPDNPSSGAQSGAPQQPSSPQASTQKYRESTQKSQDVAILRVLLKRMRKDK
jgi:hypothetical protein